jgi:hypothetical protein
VSQKSTSKCKRALHSAARFSPRALRSLSTFPLDPRLLCLARQLPSVSGMKLWESQATAAQRRPVSSRHEFVIGLRDSNLFSGKERLYYYKLCKWSFLVCGTSVAVVDEDGQPLVGDESFNRFNAFGDGPCPVLETFASEVLADVDKSRLSLRSKYDELSNLASGHFPTRPHRTRPVLRVFAGLRENLGRRS